MRHRTTLLMTALCLLAGWAVSLAPSQPGTFPDGSRAEVSCRGYFPEVANGTDVSEKDSSRFADAKGWGFFNFGNHAAPAEPAAEAPHDAYAGCHLASANEDMVFTAFSQLLKPLASQHSTIRPLI